MTRDEMVQNGCSNPDDPPKCHRYVHGQNIFQRDVGLAQRDGGEREEVLEAALRMGYRWFGGKDKVGRPVDKCHYLAGLVAAYEAAD